MTPLRWALCGLVVGVILTWLYAYLKRHDELSQAWRDDVRRRQRAMGDETNVVVRGKFHDSLRDTARYTARNGRR